MRRGRLAIVVCLSVMASVALTQTAGAFGGRGGRGGGGAPGGRASGGHQSGGHQSGGHGSAGSGFKGFKPGFNGFKPGFNGGYNRSFPGLDSFGFRGFPGFRGGGGFGAFIPWGATTSVWPSGPVYDYANAAPAYYPATYYAPAYPPPAPPYAPPAGGSISVAPAPLAPPPPSVVSFPGGRYELRGDGGTTPYQWVWVPNPPTAPPPPPTAPPPAPEGPPPAADAAPARRTQLYRWTDEQGVVHWTNQADAVPAKYRSQAKHGPS